MSETQAPLSKKEPESNKMSESNKISESKEESEKKFKEWSQKEFIKIQNFCASKGYQVKKVEQPKSQLLPPVLGIWYVKTTEKNLDLWVISGDFPTDIASSKVAKNAREVLRYFSMTWHIQAAKLEDGVAEGKIELQDKETQAKFASQLTSRAESLYEMFNSDDLWRNTDLTQ